MNVDAAPTSLTEIEFKAHPAGKEFMEVCSQMGIDVSKWEFSYCEHDTDPCDYCSNESPWRHGHASYNHPELENHTLWIDFNDSEGKWELDTIQITQD